MIHTVVLLVFMVNKNRMCFRTSRRLTAYYWFYFMRLCFFPAINVGLQPSLLICLSTALEVQPYFRVILSLNGIHMIADIPPIGNLARLIPPLSPFPRAKLVD